MKHLLTSMLLASAAAGGCVKCNPGGPTAPAVSFSGAVAAAGLVFHDVVVPDHTDGVDLTVAWTSADTQLRVIQIDPGCDPVQRTDCPVFSDPAQPRPGAPGEIVTRLNHQGSAMLGRVRFVIRNVDGPAASYTAKATPERNGCDR
jgi:hypothetical protein